MMLAAITVVWKTKSIAMIDCQPCATRWKFECGEALARLDQVSQPFR